MDMSRDFKGIWIPKEIWLHPELSIEEKVLLAEISSLDGQDGCFASNEYLSNFFGWNERSLRAHISRLKKLGFIRQESFNGRTRILRTCKQTSQEIFDQSDRKKSSGLTGRNHPVCSPMSVIEPDNKDYNKEKNLPPPSSGSSSCDPASPEEEEELELRFRRRPKGSHKVQVKKKWMEVALINLRAEKMAEKSLKSVLDEKDREWKRNSSLGEQAFLEYQLSPENFNCKLLFYQGILSTETSRGEMQIPNTLSHEEYKQVIETYRVHA